MNLNKVFLIGRMTKDPELKTTQSGMSVVNITIATNRIWKSKDGKKNEDTQFHNCVAFGRTAEVINQYIVKGQEILVEGRVETKAYEKRDGSKAYSTNIMIDSMQMGARPQGAKQATKPIEDEDIPVIEDGEGIDIKDIPF